MLWKGPHPQLLHRLAIMPHYHHTCNGIPQPAPLFLVTLQTEGIKTILVCIILICVHKFVEFSLII